MNYLRTYCNLIRKAEQRGYTKKKAKEQGLYVEGHHTFPKSIFGKNNRIVYLTAREHYIAHALLERIFIQRYGLNDYRSIKMTHAFWKMTHKKSGDKEYYFNSNLYQKLKERIGISVYNRCSGKKQSREHVEKMKKTKYVYEYLITSPDGKKYITNSLNNFCLEHNLHTPTMCYVSQGKRKHYKKWTVKIINIINPNLITSKKQREQLRKSRLKTYYFISPENVIIEVKDIDQHCKHYDLSKRQMQRLSNGYVNFHSGWRRYEK